MNVKDIQRWRNDTSALLRDGRLHDAFAAVRQFAGLLPDSESVAAIRTLEQNYEYMLKYMADGVADPSRPALYAGIKADARAVVDSLTRKAMLPETPTLYYSAVRAAGLRRSETVGSLITAIIAEVKRLDTDYNSLSDPLRRVKLEGLGRDLFYRVWTAFPLEATDVQQLRDYIANPHVPEAMRRWVVSAVGLGLTEFYDPRRIILLADLYQAEPDTPLALAAFEWLLIGLFRYRLRQHPSAVTSRIKALGDMPQWKADLNAAALEFVRTRDTDRINRKMRDEVIPQMMKMSTDIRKKMESGDIELDPEEIAAGANPEWEDMLKSNGLSDKLKELSEIQADGGDVFMSTFSHLKQGPFFNELPNWFLPFHTEHSMVAQVDDLGSVVGDNLRDTTFLCDSDKFSVAMTLAGVPRSQRENMMRGFTLQSEQLHQMQSEIAKADPRTRRTAEMRRGLQNLYRFYKLFRRKGEFFDPFDHEVNLIDIPVLKEYFDGSDIIDVLAEFFFKYRYWKEALALFELIDSSGVAPSAQRMQKIGYCHEQAGDLGRAIDSYETAELLDDTSAWTLRRLAACCRKTGNAARAASYYHRLAERFPDDASVALNYGYALSEKGDFEAASKQFFKVDYLQPGSVRANRALAWTQFMTGKFDTALAAYERLIAGSPTAGDLLNAGHVCLGLGRVRDAVGYYRMSLDASGGTIDALRADLAADADYLRRAGISTDILPLVLDAVQYSSDNMPTF